MLSHDSLYSLTYKKKSKKHNNSPNEYRPKSSSVFGFNNFFEDTADPKTEVLDPINIDFNYLGSDYITNLKNIDQLNHVIITFFNSYPTKVLPYTSAEWIAILHAHESTEDKEKLYTSVQNGLPPELRIEIWLYLAHTKQLQEEYESKDITYEKLKVQESLQEEKIKKDVRRSCTEHEFYKNDNSEKLESIHRVLRAYANLDPEVGYTQGMNFIVAMLLYFVYSERTKKQENDQESAISIADCEKDVFWILVYIMKEKNWRMCFINHTPKLQTLLENFENQLKDTLPEVHKLMAEHMCLPACFAQYFLTILIYKSPLELAKRVLESFLLVGEEIVLHVLIQNLMICEKEILKHQEIGDLYSFLRNELLLSLVK